VGAPEGDGDLFWCCSQRCQEPNSDYAMTLAQNFRTFFAEETHIAEGCSGTRWVPGLAERSSWTRFSSSVQIPAGILPENLFLARISRCNCLQFFRAFGIGPEKELLERSRFWSLGRLQIEGGIAPERLLP
jgi:hypothetical protein